MRQFLMALILVVPLCSSALGQSAGNAGAVLFDRMAQAKCNKPDSKLIKPGTSDKYNAQAKGFNDCLRVYVENENNKIARIRAEASAEFDRIQESATSQIRDIERAINTAIIEVKIVNGEAQASDLPRPGTELASFPGAECNKPDAALLVPARGKRVASIQNTDRYEGQRLAYEACMRTYVAQAKNQIKQVQANAQLAFHRVAEDANPRIIQINNDVSEALAEASKAAGERNAVMSAFHSSSQGGGLDPAGSQPGGLGPISFQPPQSQPGTESVTVSGERLPRSADMPTGAGNPGAISCRIPQQLPGSRMMGPEICKRNRDWAKLFKEGRSVSADGKQIVEAEKARTFNPQTCLTKTFVPTGAPITVCSQGDR